LPPAGLFLYGIRLTWYQRTVTRLQFFGGRIRLCAVHALYQASVHNKEDIKMSIARAEDDADRDGDRETDAMQARLHKDIDSWSSARADDMAHPAGEFPAAAIPAPSKARRKAVVTPAPAAKPEIAGAKKPFSMSYGGVSTAEHIAYRISRGAR
jgi:hypothetical protein